MYILNYSGNWNDEITVDGFVIIRKKDKAKIISSLENYDSKVYINIGDDELEYEDGKELLDEISFEPITPDDAEVIEKYFGKFNDFGYNLLSNINKILNNEEEDLTPY